MTKSEQGNTFYIKCEEEIYKQLMNIVAEHNVLLAISQETEDGHHIIVIRTRPATNAPCVRAILNLLKNTGNPENGMGYNCIRLGEQFEDIDISSNTDSIQMELVRVVKY